jgi:phage head maturation protease
MTRPTCLRAAGLRCNAPLTCADAVCGRRALTASAPPADLELSAEVAMRASSVDTTRRTITGLIVPGPDQVGQTSAGPTRFALGSLTWAEPRRVKLLREHQHADALGYALSLTWTTDGLLGTFYLPPSSDPAEEASRQRALADADSGVRDGLSVGASALVATYDADGVLNVTGGSVRETSLVSVPAFDSSRVSAVVASHNTERGNPRMFTAAQIEAARRAGVDTNDNAAVQAFLDSLTASAPQGGDQGQPAPAPVVQGPAAPTQVTAAQVRDEIMDALRSGQFTIPTATHQAAPQGVQASTQGLTLAQFTQAAVEGYQTGQAPQALRAALSDIVPGDSPAAFRPAYLDELWKGSDYRRKFIDLATTTRPLPKALKIIGHRWVAGEAPEVDDYAGDKTAVPSGPVSMEDIEVAVQRLAGAHDVDRAYMDLGSPEWLAAYFEAQTEDYRRKSDLRAAAAAYAGATALVDDDASPATFPTLLEGVVQAVVDAATVGEGVEYVAMAPGLVKELLGVTTMDAPAFFGGSFQLNMTGDGNMGGVNWFTTPGLSGTQFLVGQKAAVRWHEFEPPVRVQAVNVANGGIDLGVFGYYATYVRNAAQIRKGTVGA